eukprot:GILJ01003878.1.p1 GENE.GILJ01003878.1~~GILJ01003878.1.p1  ORF type:complete len:132 (-),score=7.60 GILJ01003878.1:204-599(-)
MCSRGVFQLSRLNIQYCDWGGSSKGVRLLLDQLDKVKQELPGLNVQLTMKRSRHPHLDGFYVNGYRRTIGVKNQSPREVLDVIKYLRSAGGHAALPHNGKHVYTNKPSIQGSWHPSLFTPHSNIPKLEPQQ